MIEPQKDESFRDEGRAWRIDNNKMVFGKKGAEDPKLGVEKGHLSIQACWVKASVPHWYSLACAEMLIWNLIRKNGLLVQRAQSSVGVLYGRSFAWLQKPYVRYYYSTIITTKRHAPNIPPDGAFLHCVFTIVPPTHCCAFEHAKLLGTGDFFRFSHKKIAMLFSRNETHAKKLSRFSENVSTDVTTCVLLFAG